MATTKNNKKLNWRKKSDGVWLAKDITISEGDGSDGFVAWCDEYENDEMGYIISEESPVSDLATAKVICQEWYEIVYPDVKKYLDTREQQDKARKTRYERESELEDQYEKAMEKLFQQFISEDDKFESKLDTLYEKIGAKAEKFSQKVQAKYPYVPPKPEPKSVITDAMIDAAIESMNSKQSRESVKKALEAAIERNK